MRFVTSTPLNFNLPTPNPQHTHTHTHTHTENLKQQQTLYIIKLAHHRAPILPQQSLILTSPQLPPPQLLHTSVLDTILALLGISTRGMIKRQKRKDYRKERQTGRNNTHARASSSSSHSRSLNRVADSVASHWRARETVRAPKARLSPPSPSTRSRHEGESCCRCRRAVVLPHRAPNYWRQ